LIQNHPIQQVRLLPSPRPRDDTALTRRESLKMWRVF
jgi:hypothetical protein